MAKSDQLRVPDSTKAAFDPILKALGPARKAVAGAKDVVGVRPGYHYPPEGDPVPALVVSVTPGTVPVRADDLAHQLGIPVSLADADIDEQVAPRPAGVSFAAPGAPTSALEALLTGGTALDFAPPKRGAYEPLDPDELPLVDERMKATICVSPEAGWAELEEFLAGTEERLTVAMYQFTAPHVFEAVMEAVEPEGRELMLVLHPVPEPPPRSGTKANDLPEEKKVLAPLRKALGDRFSFSWATLKTKAHPDGQWASAYHIKVAVRDGTAFWLSSGNWQSSNQPDVHLFGPDKEKAPPGLQRKYNRDYHAVIENKKLAAAYERYIKRDFDLTSEGEVESFALPDLFVPEEEEPEAVAFAAPPQFFPPLVLDRKVKVRPLLTPDNYAEHTIDLIKKAKESVWFQNQYINFRNTGEDFPEFKRLIAALKKKIDDDLDVRIICRDMMKQTSVDVLVALGFPRKLMRFQRACHNKTIIVDGKTVIFGSHNWSNEGVATNRDASLIFFDEEVAEYLGQVYEYDWERLATAKPARRKVRVARAGEPPPPGFHRVPFSAVFEDESPANF
jgi:hypothetical protein